MRRGRQWVLAVLLGGLTGCQTWVPTAGVTLPSGRYLQHPPQYLPTSPDFTLPREMAKMQTQAIEPQAAPGQLPPPLPAAGP
jgi:hypothetical protein